MPQNILVPVSPNASSFFAPPAWEIKCYGQQVASDSDHQGWYVIQSQNSPQTLTVTVPTDAPVDNYTVRWCNGQVRFMNWSISTGTFTVGPG